MHTALLESTAANEPLGMFSVDAIFLLIGDSDLHKNRGVATYTQNAFACTFEPKYVKNLTLLMDS